MQFTSERLSDHLLRIRCPGRVYAYLVLGDKRALVIDTGLGCGDLSKYVKKLTNLPVSVFLTHGHLDHAGGLIGFEDIWLHPADRALLESDSVEARYEYTAGNHEPNENIERSSFQPSYKGETKDLLPGKIFDLGGASVEAVSLPGHTDGMLAAYILPERALLLGDGLNSGTFLFTGNSSISQYRKVLEDLLPFTQRAETVLYSHPHNFGGKEIIREGIAVCNEILEKNDAHISVPIGLARGTEIFAAKELTPEMRNADGTSANFLYRAEQVR